MSRANWWSTLNIEQEMVWVCPAWTNRGFITPPVGMVQRNLGHTSSRHGAEELGHTSSRHGAEESGTHLQSAWCRGIWDTPPVGMVQRNLGHTSSQHGAEESGIINFALTICDKISKPRDELFNKFTWSIFALVKVILVTYTYRGLLGLVVVWLSWLSGRALTAQAGSVLGSTPSDCRPFLYFSPHNI